MYQEAKINHVGFIMDGNRRWAKQHTTSLFNAYSKGADVFFNTILTCIKENILSVTFYALSFDNLMKRTKEEINTIYNVVISKLQNKKTFFEEKKIKLKFIGVLGKLDTKIQSDIKDLEESTQKNLGIHVFILSVYDPIKDLSYLYGKNSIDNELYIVSSQDINQLDLIIRTGGHNRLSGFLPFQSMYAHLITLELYWPELEEQQTINIFKYYKKSVQQNYGK